MFSISRLKENCKQFYEFQENKSADKYVKTKENVENDYKGCSKWSSSVAEYVSARR